MAIAVSYDHHADLRCEVVVFLDDETGDCFQIQCDLPGAPGAYRISAGVGPPVEHGVVAWQCAGTAFDFALSAKAATMFGGNARLHFEVEPVGGDTIESITAHLERMMCLQQPERRE